MLLLLATIQQPMLLHKNNNAKVLPKTGTKENIVALFGLAITSTTALFGLALRKKN